MIHLDLTYWERREDYWAGEANTVPLPTIARNSLLSNDYSKSSPSAWDWGWRKFRARGGKMFNTRLIRRVPTKGSRPGEQDRLSPRAPSRWKPRRCAVGAEAWS